MPDGVPGRTGAAGGGTHVDRCGCAWFLQFRSEKNDPQYWAMSVVSRLLLLEKNDLLLFHHWWNLLTHSDGDRNPTHSGIPTTEHIH